MAQQTNLNASPYYDDFDSNNNYHKVLFKPGYPVQARELTGLQSILQNQIEKFGNHFFKEGAKVIPGNTAYTKNYYAVQLNNDYLGVPVSSYIDQLLNVKIIGLSSGVTAIVEKILMPEDSEKGNLTLYVAYVSANVSDNSTKTFTDGEQLVTDKDIITGVLNNIIIPSGEVFSSLIFADATSTGSSFSISNGVYFVRGNFVNVKDETLILDQYSNTPSYRIGLYVNEEIITSDIDETLTDNSKGFNNYAAPGADRLKISCSLFKKPLDNYNDNNFIELATVYTGILRSQVVNTNYNIIADELARRTYAESGDYYVTPFDVNVKESLNDYLGNNGIFSSGQLTYGGQQSSKDLAVYKISPGKAFIRGYEVETISPLLLDVPKPRTTKLLENQAINYNTGSTFTVNRVFGHPTIGVGNTYVLSLRDSRVGVSSLSQPGKEIGLARVYDFALESGSYDTGNSNLNRWDISLYDIQFVSEITLNQPITLPIPAFIKGKYSGATAFLKDAISAGVALTVYQKSGDFLEKEPFIINGDEVSRIAIAVTSYGVGDVKSVYGIVGSASTFTADILQSNSFNIGIATITAYNSIGISTITSNTPLFPGTIAKVGNLVKFTGLSLADPTIAKIVSIGSSSVAVTGVTTVSGISQGRLPTSLLSVTDLQLLTTKLSFSQDNTLYTQLSKNNIESLDLTNSTIIIRKTFTVNIASNQLSIPVAAGTNETFLPFDEERYTLVKSNGDFEILTPDKFIYSNGSASLQIQNLGTNDTGATLITTLSKIKPKAKVKRKNKINTIIVDKSKLSSSGIGASTLNDGLTYGNYPYGTRVQDETICLNQGDILDVLGIFESNNTSNSSAPKITLSLINGPSTKTTDLIIGERFIGKTTNTVAIYAERLSDSQISFVTKNESNFKEGETVIFQESKIAAVVSVIDSPSKNISANFTFNNGQIGTLYDYGFITRKFDIKEPSKSLKIYFTNAYYDSSDDGDITTVESYNLLDYDLDIQTVNGIRNTDIIDIRPKVSNYTVTSASRSPLEFYGRTFNSSGNSAANILASDEDIKVNFAFYLGRVDRIFVGKDGKFQIQYGEPSETYKSPITLDDSLEIASIKLPPYLFNVSQAQISFLEHKRYTMSDIKQLENRIKSLEYYTSLSLLETNTSNLFVPDSAGLNRFKSGFFVDNFTTLKPQDISLPIKNSVDVLNQELRPQHYTNSIDLTLSRSGLGANESDDKGFITPFGSNIKRSKDIITLDYTEVLWLKQTFATRTESVTPFLVSFWQGSLTLYPESDTWVDTARMNAKIISQEGNFASTMAIAQRTLGIDPQTGMSPILWNSWETTWTGQEVKNTTGPTNTTSTTTTGAFTNTNTISTQGPGESSLIRNQHDIITTTTTTQDQFREVIDTGFATRTGVRTIITEQFDNTSIGDKVVSRDIISTMRSRNIEIKAKKMKPLSQLYGFFDGVDVTKYCTPKLLEVTMLSGVFSVGEKIVGTVLQTGINQSIQNDSLPSIKFRVAVANHKEGPYNSPTEVYTDNPYTSKVSNAGLAEFLGTSGTVQLPGQSQVLPASYSSTSTILNVDTYSLASQTEGEYSGYVQQGMVLVGQTSGSTAQISNVRLISDLSASLYGNFFIPNPNINVYPKFQTGTKVFTLTDSSTNNSNTIDTVAEGKFTSSGTLETVQENIISVRNAKVENKSAFDRRDVRQTTGSQRIGTNVIATSQTTQSFQEYYDPLAQSFNVADEGGIFITRCDVYFQTKDDANVPLTFQIRTMQNGAPTQKILPFSEIIVYPKDIQISQTGTVATSFIFEAPVYLSGGTEYAMCIASWSTKYKVFISRVGEVDLLTNEFISNQPYLGSLFKSQNASTWEPSQWEDLKFDIYRAEFTPTGTVEVYSPDLTQGNNQIPVLMPNSLNLNSKKIRIGLSSALQDSGLSFGNTILQQGTNATGNYVGNAGIATGTLSIVNAGIGYTPSSGSNTFSNVTLNNVVGSGRDGTANITISNGVAVAATISSSGTGYQVGDIFSISSIGIASIGQNARFSLVSIAGTNQFILDNVQGDFVVAGTASTVQYNNNLGITTTLNSSSGGNIQISNINTISDGLHVVVKHKNHGMYFETNNVTISNTESDIVPTKLVLAYNSSATSSISVDDSSRFTTFENVGIGTTNPGYIKVGEELVSYTSVSSGVLSGITRAIDSTIAGNYTIGIPVYKYELGGVSLRRINKTHSLDDVTVSNPITFDSYNIRINMSSNGIGRTTGTSFPNLYINQTKSAGGVNIRATQNMPFEAIVPSIQNTTVSGTTISSQIRTISGSSISATNEIPFVNKGYEEVTLNTTNYLKTPRIIASKVNELIQLTNLPGNKSLSVSLNLATSNSKVSPVIDTQRMSVILISNRVNNVITDYTTDNRVNSLTDDPTAAQYITNEVRLENPATSIKVILDAHINGYSDIRLFYSISQENGFTPIFTPFPGYKNLNANKQIISFAQNDGQSDTFVPKTSILGFNSNDIEFKEYNFTADSLPSFKSYRIKILLTGKNQVYVPRVKNLRVISLA